MSATIIAISLIAAHFIGDWLCQTRYIAENKSKFLAVLCAHVCIVGCALCVAFMSIGYGWTNWRGLALLIYLVAHGVQDWFIWRIYGKYWHDPANPDKKGKAFYNTIAIDQFIHLSLLMYLFL